MPKVKICGLTNKEDALFAEKAGADYLGFVFFDKSPRSISADEASGIISGLKGTAKKVGLFLNAYMEDLKHDAALAGVDHIQLHGDESPEYVRALKGLYTVIKSFKISKDFDFNILNDYSDADYYLFDTYKKGIPGGTGMAFDWKLIKGRSFNKPFFLAGGLNPSNVVKAISTVKPYAVDVASGVEKQPRVKDHKIVEDFINATR